MTKTELIAKLTIVPFRERELEMIKELKKVAEYIKSVDMDMPLMDLLVSMIEKEKLKVSFSYYLDENLSVLIDSGILINYVGIGFPISELIAKNLLIDINREIALRE